jgi:hypothetical protein
MLIVFSLTEQTNTTEITDISYATHLFSGVLMPLWQVHYNAGCLYIYNSVTNFNVRHPTVFSNMKPRLLFDSVNTTWI